MEKLFGLISKGCFQGHTHVPGVFLESLEFITPEQVDYRFPIGQERFMVNVRVRWASPATAIPVLAM
jgi:hypothetical protein